MNATGLMEGSLSLAPGESCVMLSTTLVAADDVLRVDLRYTTDGSEPTVESRKLVTLVGTRGNAMRITRELTNGTPEEVLIRWLLVTKGAHSLPEPFGMQVLAL